MMEVDQLDGARSIERSRPAQRRVLIAIAIILAVSVAAAWLLWPHRPAADPALAQGDHLESARAAHRVFDRMPTAPVTSTEAVVQALNEAPPIPAQPFTVDPPPTSVEQKLYTRIAEWLQLRHEGDPYAYAEWARSRGCVLTLTLDGAEERFPNLGTEASRAEVYEHHTGEPPSGDLSPMEYFVFSFRTTLALQDDLLRPAAIATGPQAAHVLFKRVPRGLHLVPLERWEGADLWHSGRTAGSALHWAPPVLFDELLERDGEALGALVLSAVKNIHGEWVPTMFTAYWAPTYEDWYFFQVSFSNTRRFHTWFVI